MKAVLLAGGIGTRISRLIQWVPKSTVPVNGKPLIYDTVEKLHKAGICEIAVCTGYKKEIVQRVLDGFEIQYYHNPFYDITNSIATLWFAKEYLNDDCLLMNSDVFFDDTLLHCFLSSKRDSALCVDSSRIAEGDYFLGLDTAGCVKTYGKELPFEQRNCEYVGLAMIRMGFLETFLTKLKQLVDTQQHQLWWEDVLYQLADQGERIYTVDIHGKFWAEVDYFEDYQRILDFVKV